LIFRFIAAFVCEVKYVSSLYKIYKSTEEISSKNKRVHTKQINSFFEQAKEINS